MCNFFSVCSKDGKPYYFDWALREKVIKGELKFEPDSHTSILDYYGFKGLTQDRFNKYEYNPFTKVFQIDQMNNEDDHLLIKDFCKKLDFKTIVPQLTFNPIIHPFKDRKPRKVTKKDLKLLKQWVSIRDSARDSVGYRVWDSVWASVRDSIGTSVGTVLGTVLGLVFGTVLGIALGIALGTAFGPALGPVLGTAFGTALGLIYLINSS